jgi:hypothetical protein
MTMRITIGRGRNRISTEIATGPHVPKAEREQTTWQLKQILFNRGYLKSLA